MKQLKKKKGFTLVELIVVIAIIAILAAVAVPTTMHFVEKANISKEAQQMNITSILDGVFTSSSVTPFDITNKTAENGKQKISKVLEDAGAKDNASIGTITLTVTGAKDKWTVAYSIVGATYKDNKLEGTISGTFTDAQIFDGATAKAGSLVLNNALADATNGSSSGWVDAK